MPWKVKRPSEERCRIVFIRVASHGHFQLFPLLSQSLVSVELPPFPGIDIIGDPALFSAAVSELRLL